jgi:hypothetical protein
MGISTADLYQIAGFNTDQVAGFQAQVSSGRWKREVLWPEHLKGKRYRDFCFGSSVARDWMRLRATYAKVRRSARAKDFKEIGATTNLLPEGAEKKEEQLSCLRQVLRYRTPPKDET